MAEPRKRRIYQKRRRGTGSIFQRKDGRWVAILSRGPRSDRQTIARYCRTEAEAKVALAELLKAHGPLKATTLMVGDYLDRWVRDARDLRPRTRMNYASVIRVHLQPELGLIRLADLSPLHVEGLLARLSRVLAPKTVRNVHLVLQAALGAAQRAELIARNPAARQYVKAPRVAFDEPDALTLAEIAKLREVLPGHPLEAHVLLALGTGLRQGEQLGLAWEDVDLAAGVLRVHWELARIDGRYQRVEPKTPRSRRTVPLVPALVEALREHRARLVAAGFAPIATGPVFVNARGEALSGRWLLGAWWKLLEQAGIRRRPWKVLRATFGSRLFDAGVPDRSIADLLGHARTYTTHRHYVSTAPASGDVIEAVGRLVG